MIPSGTHQNVADETVTKSKPNTSERTEPSSGVDLNETPIRTVSEIHTAVPANEAERLMQTLRVVVRAALHKSSGNSRSSVEYRKTIVRGPLAVPCRDKSKTQLKRLRAAEMEFWETTGGDVLHDPATQG